MSVDILMATYNGEKYLAEQLDSIIGQTHTDWRLLVSDDRSTDGTMSILRRYAAQDPRITIVSDSVRYGGPKENFWNLLKRSEAPYAMFCDQDDVWHPDKIESSLARMLEMESEKGEDEPLLVFTDLRVVDKDLAVRAESFMRLEEYYSIDRTFDNLLLRNVAPGCVMLFNRALRELAMMPDQLDFIEIHDWWLMIVASALGHVLYIDQPTIDYRQHENNAIGASRGKKIIRIPDFSNARRKARTLRKRAQAVISFYGDMLDAQQKERLTILLRTGEGGIKGVRALVASGFWDNTKQRRAGQIAAALLP